MGTHHNLNKVVSWMKFTRKNPTFAHLSVIKYQCTSSLYIDHQQSFVIQRFEGPEFQFTMATDTEFLKQLGASMHQNLTIREGVVN